MMDQLQVRVREVISAYLLLAFFTASCFAQSALDRYTRCDLGSDFEIVQVDRLPQVMTPSVDTPSGTKEVLMTDGYRVLIAYKGTEPFVNLKAEQFEAARYQKDKASLIASLESAANGTPNMESDKPAKLKIGRFETYAINRTKLEGGVLSTYELFDDPASQVLTAYILNAEPEERQFKTIDEYHELRNRFLQKLGACGGQTTATQR